MQRKNKASRLDPRVACLNARVKFRQNIKRYSCKANMSTQENIHVSYLFTLM